MYLMDIKCTVLTSSIQPPKYSVNSLVGFLMKTIWHKYPSPDQKFLWGNKLRTHT